MKNTLACNPNLITEILELYYVQNLDTKEIYRKIKKKISKNSIYKILSKFKLYLEYKNWFKYNCQNKDIESHLDDKNEIFTTNLIKYELKSNKNKEK